MDTGTHRIRVLVAEDNHDLAAAITALIAAECDMQVDGIVDRVSHLFDLDGSNAHVLVLDLELCGESSVPALAHMQRALPQLAVIIYSGHDPRDLGSVLARIDRCEYVMKSGNPDELIDAIRRAANKATGAEA